MSTDATLAVMSDQLKNPARRTVIIEHSQSGVGNNLFAYQQQVMPLLLGWAVGSIVSGVIWQRSRSTILRGLGSQFVVWGTVDGAIAAAAIANASPKIGQVESGEMTPQEHSRLAEIFKRIVWLNALLDIGYMLGGLLMVRRSPQDRRRQGMGWGIVIQGAFLFVWDVLLVALTPKVSREL